MLEKFESHSRSSIIFLVVIQLSLFLGLGCANKRAVKTAESGHEHISYGPPPPEPGQLSEASDNLENSELIKNMQTSQSQQVWTRSDEFRSKGVVIFLGAGLSNSFSAVGLFRALEKNKIPVKGLVCTELSGILCSLYSFMGLSGMEWAMTQIKNDNYFDFSLLTLTAIVPLKSALGNLKSLLKKMFQDRLIESAKIPLYLVAEDRSTETTLYFTKGDLVKALMASQQHPDWGQGLEYDGHNYFSTIEALEDSFNLVHSIHGIPIALSVKPNVRTVQMKESNWSLKERSKNHINTVMNAILEKQHNIFSKSIQKGIQLLEIETNTEDISDLSARAEIVYTGYVKAKEWLNEPLKPKVDAVQ